MTVQEKNIKDFGVKHRFNLHIQKYADNTSASGYWPQFQTKHLATSSVKGQVTDEGCLIICHLSRQVWTVGARFGGELSSSLLGDGGGAGV